MPVNHSFWRSIHSFAHPLSMSAVVLVLLNDHFLRVYWPSWWTGKVGDFAWLLFAPFLVAIPLSWLVPRVIDHEKKVGWLAFILTILGFTFVKTSSLGQIMAIRVLETLAGWQTNVVMDSTDLIALSSLFIGWKIWWKAKNEEPALSPRTWVILALGIVGTLATGSADPPFEDYGVTCINYERLGQKSILATYTPVSYQTYARFISTDGGLTWSSKQSNYQGSWAKVVQ